MPNYIDYAVQILFKKIIFLQSRWCSHLRKKPTLKFVKCSLIVSFIESFVLMLYKL